MFVGGSFYVNCFVIDLRFLPSAVDAVFIRCGWVESLDVQILYIRAVVGKAPSDAVVVADDDQRCAGQSESLYVPAGGGDVDFVPDGRKPKFQVGVVGQQRLTISSMCAVDHPVVAAQALANFLLNFEQGIA